MLQSFDQVIHKCLCDEFKWSKGSYNRFEVITLVTRNRIFIIKNIMFLVDIFSRNWQFLGPLCVKCIQTWSPNVVFVQNVCQFGAPIRIIVHQVWHLGAFCYIWAHLVTDVKGRAWIVHSYCFNCGSKPGLWLEFYSDFGDHCAPSVWHLVNRAARREAPNQTWAIYGKTWAILSKREHLVTVFEGPPSDYDSKRVTCACEYFTIRKLGE